MSERETLEEEEFFQENLHQDLEDEPMEVEKIDFEKLGFHSSFTQWKLTFSQNPDQVVKLLEDTVEKLKYQQLKVETRKQKIDLSVLKKDNHLQDQSKKLNLEISELEKNIQRISCRINQLQRERFELFLGRIQSLNVSLSKTYKELNPMGDCELMFSPQRELIFDGISLKVGFSLFAKNGSFFF